MNYSTEQIAHISVVIGFILGFFKIKIGTDEITSFLSALFIVGGSLYGWIKRYSRGDITLGGWKRRGNHEIREV